MPSLTTTHGPIDESLLARTVGFEDRPSEFVVWVEWRLVHDGRDCAICANPDNPFTPVNGSTLVRRDAHCILKDAGVLAGALAASF